jgi:hypothetical protein
MRRVLLSLSAALVALGAGVAVAAPDPAGLAAKLGQGATNQAGAYCRVADRADDQCSAVDGRGISDAALSAYQRSWGHRALALQRDLSAIAPLIDDQIPHTHNTFNASAYSVPTDGSAPSYYPTLTNQDPNQVYSITDQLDMDVRAIELDLHWVPSPFGTPATDGYWVTMCHGDGQQAPGAGVYVHVGCTADRPAQDGFAEVRRWLDRHRDQVVLVYLENQLYAGLGPADAELAHATAVGLLQQAFGSLVYRPKGTTPGHCATLPYATSRAAIAATGARVLLVGNCGPAGWSSWVYERGGTWNESGDPTAYSAADCARDRQARIDDTQFRRVFEDSTFVSAATGAPKPPMSADAVRTMVHCGVNIIGMDQLRPQDGRLAALVWSWAPDEPSAAGDCALQDAGGRMRAADCRRALPAACRTADGRWSVTRVAVPWRAAAQECADETGSGKFSVPVNAVRNDQLAGARPAGTPAVWLDYARVSGTWRPEASGLPGHPGRPGRGHAYGRGHGRGKPSGVPHATLA